MRPTILALAALTLATPAFAAGHCAQKISQLQSRYNAAPVAKGEAPAADTTSAATETTGAKLHHQPAAGSAADADDAATSRASVRDAEFKVALEEAQAAEHSGDEGTCETAAARAEQALAQ